MGILDKYSGVQFLGSGTFGIVFKGVHHTRPMNQVAVKLLFLHDERIAELAERERDLLTDIQQSGSHPNIVELERSFIFDMTAEELEATISALKLTGSDKIPLLGVRNQVTPTCVIEMKLCGEMTLRHWIEEYSSSGGADPEVQMEIVKGIVKGLAFLHGRAKPIIHRDIKPSNILFTFEKGQEFGLPVKLADFGYGRIFDNNSVKSMTGGVGTTLYMAPEVMRSAPYDSSADVYSAGLVIWEVVQLIHPKRRADFFFRLTQEGVGLSEIMRPEISVPMQLLIQRMTRDKTSNRMRNIVDALKELDSPYFPKLKRIDLEYVVDSGIKSPAGVVMNFNYSPELAELDRMELAFLQSDWYLTHWALLAEELGVHGNECKMWKDDLKRGNSSIRLITRRILNSCLKQNKPLQVAHETLERLSDKNYLELPRRSKGLQLRNLELHSRIDAGFFSEVFQGRNYFDNKEYALKRVSIKAFMELATTTVSTDPQAYFRRAHQEIFNMAKLEHHPNLVQYHNAFFDGPSSEEYGKLFNLDQGEVRLKLPDVQVDDFMYTQMELLDTNLERLVENGETTLRNIDGSKSCMRQIFEGLSFMHGNKFIHRNLKPSNILVKTVPGPDLIFKIGDFGCSRHNPEAAAELTAYGIVEGCKFSSPEIRTGRYNYKTDIYSCGLIWVFMLCEFSTNVQMEECFKNVSMRILEPMLALLDHVNGNDNIIELLKMMTSFAPGERPEASQALSLLS